MKILEKGHVYELDFIDGKAASEENHLVFVNRESGKEHAGTQTQEVLRALIDRTYHCDNCLPSEFNERIIHHLRMALVYHEARALVRKQDKEYFNAEEIEVSDDGHFRMLTTGPSSDLKNSASKRNFDKELK